MKKIQGLLLYNSERLSPREKREGNLCDMQPQRTTASAAAWEAARRANERKKERSISFVIVDGVSSFLPGADTIRERPIID